MSHDAPAALMQILRPEIDLGKSRLETVCRIVIGMVSARSVNLGHLASEPPGAVKTTSTCFYLFVFKLSVHFCRLHKNVDRSPLRATA